MREFWCAARLAEKDEYTERHIRRVALRAVQVGEALGLAPRSLRTLAAVGLLHDIGKLAVPDSILKKPAALTAEEYACIRRHPEFGYELLGELGGFSPGVRRLVLGHHERTTVRGIPEVSKGLRSRSRPGSSASATCTTRRSRHGCTARGGHPTAPSPFCIRGPARSSTGGASRRSKASCRVSSSVQGSASGLRSNPP